MIGKTLSHYKVIEKIGEGGMGEVYRVKPQSYSKQKFSRFLNITRKQEII